MQVWSITLLLFCCWSAVCAWGGKNKDKEDEMPKGKEAADLGLGALAQAARDPELLAQLLKDAQDPDMMSEAQKLMKDKKFIKEMEAFKKNNNLDKLMEEAADLLQDPRTKEVAEKYTEQLMNSGPGKRGIKRSSEGLGIDALMEASQDPSYLANALKMMDDPQAAAQVQKMMQDPEFKKTMDSVMNTPEFQSIMAESAKQMADMVKDPAKKKMLEERAREIGSMMA